MGRSLLGGLFRVTAAAAAVAGVAYLFKDEIRGTEAYQNLNSKYDVDTKIADATKKAKEAAAIAKDKAKEAAVVAKDKAYDLKDKAVDAYKNSPWSATDDDNIFEDDEIVLNEDGEAEKRDYVEKLYTVGYNNEKPLTKEIGGLNNVRSRNKSTRF